MATVYLLVLNQIETHPIHGYLVNVRNRAFVSDEVRKVAIRRLIDDWLLRLDPRQLPPELMVQVLDLVDDMRYARKTGDLSYEMGCCRDVFGVVVETQDVTIELEELVGEIIN